MRAGVAADAGEAVLEDPTREELIGHLPDDRTPRAVLARKMDRHHRHTKSAESATIAASSRARVSSMAQRTTDGIAS